MTDAAGKAAILIEALPWLESYVGKTIVVKYGGNAMVDEGLKRAFAEDIVFSADGRGEAGRRARRRAADLVHAEAAGHRERVPRRPARDHPEAMDVVRMVLMGQVNRELVGLLNAHGPLAVGLSGEDAGLLTAERKGLELDGRRSTSASSARWRR